jgi:hypothetical protein
MRKREKYSNWIGTNIDNKADELFVWGFIIIVGYYAFKGVKSLLK